MATHSSILAWRIPWTEELGGLQSTGCKESDTTERLHFHFSLSCMGEGNGNPLQCSCLENPRDSGAWWAAVYGVAQSRTRLKRLSSSSSKSSLLTNTAQQRRKPRLSEHEEPAELTEEAGQGFEPGGLIPKPHSTPPPGPVIRVCVCVLVAQSCPTL